MKSIVISCLIICACMFSACNKEYRCVCTNSNTGSVSYGDVMKANSFTKTATEEACKNNNNLSGGALKDCHLE